MDVGIKQRHSRWLLIKLPITFVDLFTENIDRKNSVEGSDYSGFQLHEVTVVIATL